MQRGVVILSLTLALVALAEGAARLAEWVRPERAEISFAYSPYRMLRMDRAPWPLDRDGFRAAELDSYRGSFLIEFLGGSVCAGVGLDPGEPIPQRLEDALRGLGLTRAKVVNLCQGGATSAQELAILIEYGLPLRPQAVLAFDGANDVLHPRPVGEDDGANLPYENAQLEARVDGRDALSHLALARVLLRLASHLPAGTGPVNEAGAVPIHAIVDSYLYHLGLERELTESRGGFYAVLLQPALHLDKPWSREESEMWNKARPQDGAKLSALIRTRYAETRQALEQWAGSNGTALYDLSHAFRAEAEPLYSDSVHFRGARGYQLLFDELERQGLVARLAERYRAWETAR